MSPQKTKQVQVADYVRGLINSGDLAPQEPVPTEEDLQKISGWSRSSVRAGLAILTNEGLIGPGASGQGKRRVVLARKLIPIRLDQTETHEQHRVTGTDSWVADVTAAGMTADPQVISVSLPKATRKVAKALGVEVGVQVIARERFRTINDGYPQSESVSYYRREIADRAPLVLSPDDVTEGVVAYMARQGIVQTLYRDWIEARMPTTEESRQLACNQGVPLIEHYRVGLAADGTPIRLTVTTYPADRSRLEAVFPA